MKMGIESIVLAVDDEPAILRLIKLGLSGDGFSVLTAGCGDEALDLLERHRPDAMILDILMPGMTGLEVMQKIRRHSHIPIILLTSRDRDEDVVRGLELGADDYLSKPFDLKELGARLRAIIRRHENRGEAEDVIRLGDIEIDLANRVLRKGGQQVRMTRLEWSILQHLASPPGTMVTNAELLTKVWGPEYANDVQYLRVWVSRIRKKIEDDPSRPTYIKTLNSRGYMLDSTGEKPVEAEHFAR
jgi:two-component system, OmpR family, KDP operon response regulator KdpE